MKFIVWKIVGEKTSNYYPKQTYCRFIFKGMDDEKSYYLNLPLVHQSYNNLLKFLKEGNIVEANLQTNKKNISYFTPITLVKEINHVADNE